MKKIGPSWYESHQWHIRGCWLLGIPMGHIPAVSDQAGTSRAVYSISAVERMVGVPARRCATGRSATADRPGAQRGRPPRLYPRPGRAAAVRRGRLERASPAEAHRLLAERVGPGDTPSSRAPTPGGRCSSCSPSATRSRPSSQSSSCGRRATRSCSLDVEEAGSLARAPASTGGRGADDLRWSGAALCRRLKEHDACVLAISPSTPVRRRCAGADAFLQKPLEPLRFVSTVKDLLGTSAISRSPPAAPRCGRARASGQARLDSILGGGLPRMGSTS